MAAVIEHEPCYIYHVRDFQEHSQIIEALSLNYGALAIVVNNGKRTNSSSQGLFQPFTPLKLSLKRGRGDLYYLTDYDCSESGYVFPLPQHFCAVYINELLHHLYKNQNQDVKLFGAYVATLEAIKNKDNIEQSLRLFELTLLESMGYALTLRDDEGVLLQKDSYYRFCFGAGFFKVDRDAMNAIIANEESLKLASDHQLEPISTYQGQSSSAFADDSDSGMMFPKSKVRGRRLESGPSFNGFNHANFDSSDAYLAMAMRNGFVTEDNLQRYQDLSHDFMGPVLSGEQISDIVRCDFILNDSVKLAKQLTSALIERLLNGKEIVSRRLYREYAQVRNAKVRAYKQAQQAQQAQKTEHDPQSSKAQQTQPAEPSSNNQQPDAQASQQLASASSSAESSQTQLHEISLAPLNHSQDQSANSNVSLAEMQLPPSNQAVSDVRVEPVSKQLFFEAHPQATTNSNSSASAAQAASTTPYISQFDFVHKCVPRDKDDAPDFLTEYLNLAPQQATSSANAEPQAQPQLTPTACKIDAQLSQQQSCDLEVPDNTSELTASTSAKEPEAIDEKLESSSSNNEAEVSALESSSLDVDSLEQSAESDIRIDDGETTDESTAAVSHDAESSVNLHRLEQELPQTEVKTAKAACSTSKTKSTQQVQTDKAKAPLNRDVQKAKLLAKREAAKAKAAAKKEAERAKSLAKKEAEKAKALAKKEALKRKEAQRKAALKAKEAAAKTAKHEAEKAKAAAKRDAEKAKALAKKEAAKRKEAEKKAALKAKQAEARALLKQQAKEKARAAAEAKEAQIEMEFAHSMLAMIDSGLKKRKRQEVKSTK